VGSQRAHKWCRVRRRDDHAGLRAALCEVLADGDPPRSRNSSADGKGARPNHVGAAIARHKRAGRIEERDGKLYAAQSNGTEQQATA
jgi:hypothetical protein